MLDPAVAAQGTPNGRGAGSAARSGDNSGKLVALPAVADDAPPPSADGGVTAPEIPILPESPSGSVLWRVRGMLRTIRPHQWVKNLFVLAPVVFAKELTNPRLIASAIGAFVVFCLLAGAVYTLNDIVDADADRIHPVKRNRPIASGCVPIPLAKVMAVALVLGALTLASLGPRLLGNDAAASAWAPGPYASPFFFVACGYIALNLLYSFGLKKIAYVDVLCLAAMFVMRVLAGGYATHTRVSLYLIACTALISLFLGFGKRRHELAGAHAGKQRSALEAYSPRALTVALAITGFATVAIYFAYTFDPVVQKVFGTTWLPLTTVHPLFGVVRFLQLVAGRPKAESPTQEMLRDVPFVLNLVLWVIEVIAFLYNVRLTTS
jgi:decaprenyl-phosphate phosphoribosyltransferase